MSFTVTFTTENGLTRPRSKTYVVVTKFGSVEATNAIPESLTLLTQLDISPGSGGISSSVPFTRTMPAWPSKFTGSVVQPPESPRLFTSFTTKSSSSTVNSPFTRRLSTNCLQMEKSSLQSNACPITSPWGVRPRGNQPSTVAGPAVMSTCSYRKCLALMAALDSSDTSDTPAGSAAQPARTNARSE